MSFDMVWLGPVLLEPFIWDARFTWTTIAILFFLYVVRRFAIAVTIKSYLDAPRMPAVVKIGPYDHTVIIEWSGRRDLRESFLDPGCCGRQHCRIRIAWFARKQAQTWRQILSDNAPCPLVAILRVGQTWESRAELLVQVLKVSVFFWGVSIKSITFFYDPEVGCSLLF